MPRWLAAICVAALSGSCGCAPWREAPLEPATAGSITGNAIILAASDRDLLWDTIVDVVDDDFEIQREERPRVLGDSLTEARLETRPQIGATVFEPWRGDSATNELRWESTLQTIRRKAFVQMIPTAGGYQVQVTVIKELENVGRPEYSATGSAVFRHDNSLRRFSDPLDPQSASRGWIPIGSDPALEQRILAKIRTRLGL